MIHHIGIAVDDLDKYIEIFTSLGGTLKFRGEAKAYDADCVFIDFGNSYIELIKGLSEDNHINKFIKKYGVGLHHIAVRGKGDTPGALPGMKVSFNKPDKNNRILIEEVEFNEEE